MLSKVKEGIRLCLNNQIDVVLGIRGGVYMDLAKAIAFGAKNPDTPIEKKKDDETFLQEALAALSKLYEEFHIVFSYGDIAKDPEDYHQLLDTIHLDR